MPLPIPIIPRLIDGTVAARTLFANLSTIPREVAGVAYLDADRRLLGLRHIPGGIDHVSVPVRRIVRDALSLNARGVILAHNHPSGDVTPSAADLEQTRHIAQALDVIGVRLVDALLLSNDRTTRFRALGLL